MARLVFFVVLATFRVVYTEVQDVTSVFRLRETGVGDDPAEFLDVDDCFGQALSCPWFKSGWDVRNSEDSKTAANECRSNLTVKNVLAVQEPSPWIPVNSNHTMLLIIEPKGPLHTVNVYLSADGDYDSEMRHSSMLILTLSSDGKHRANACLRGQQTGEEELISSFSSFKELRKCRHIPDMFLPSTHPTGEAVVYEVEYNAGTGLFAVNVRQSTTGSHQDTECNSKPLIQQGHDLRAYVKYIRLISHDTEVRFSQATLGLLLKNYYGEIVSRDIMVTPKASRLCLSIGVTRNLFSTGLNVAVRARDGRKIEFENPDTMGVDISRIWRQVHQWNYVADLKDFENQTIYIQITANSYKNGNLFLSSIRQCKEIGGEHQMTIIHQPATLEIHGNGIRDNVPFILPNYRVLDPNLGVASDCMATQDGCLEWSGFDSPSWRKKSGAEEKNPAAKPNLQIGLQRITESIGGVMADDYSGHQFVDGVNILWHDIERVDDHDQLLRVMLWNDSGNLNTSDVYVLEIKLQRAKSGALVLYKCVENKGAGSEALKLTEDLTREDCTRLQKDASGLKIHEDLLLQIAVVIKENGQEIKVFYVDDSKTQNEVLLLRYQDDSPITVTKYMLSCPDEENAYTTSYGIGSLFYSLENKTAEVNSPPFVVPEDGKICLALDYFVEGNVNESVFKVKVNGSNGIETDINHSYDRNKKGKWVHETVTGQISANEQVHLRVLFRKPDDVRFLLQRLSFCHHKDNEKALYVRPEIIPVAIFHPGARFASTNELQSVLDANDANPCQNGGERQKTGCDCPAGFSGKNCEDGCGPNRYGSGCQLVCSYTTRGCRSMLMGRPYLGFNCAPGFRGPLCDSPCEKGVTYGAGCLQKCGQCSKNTTCDPYTGVCPHGCQTGRIPPQCQQEFVYLTSQPSVTVTEDSAKLEIDLRNRTKGSGVRFWQVQYKLADGIEWLEREKLPYANTEVDLMTKPAEYTLRDLLHGTQYQARIVLRTTNPGRDYQGDKILTVSFTTLCDKSTSNEYSLSASPRAKGAGLQVSWQYPAKAGACQIVAYEVQVKGGWRWNVYRYPVTTLAYPEVNITDLLPKHTYQLRVRALTVSEPAPFSAIVRATVGGSTAPALVEDLHILGAQSGRLPVLWKASRLTGTDEEINYDIRYQCVNLLACPGLECSDQKDWWRTKHIAENLEVKDLLAHARYRVWVRPVGKGEVGNEVPGEMSSILFDTPSEVTLARPVEVTQNPALNSENSVTVMWNRPDPSKCNVMNGAFVGFRCEINPGPSTGQQGVDTAQTFLTFGGLKPSTEYHVKVFVKTSAGVNEKSYIEIKVKTHSPTLGKVGNLAIYSKGILNDKSTLSLRWEHPQLNNEDDPDIDIDRYVVNYAIGGDSNVQSRDVPVNSKCDAWPKKICYQIDELDLDTTYSVSVHAVSKEQKDGASESVEASTNEDLPGKPSHLRQLSFTENSITFSVGIPDMLNGALKHFQVIFTRIRALGEAPHRLVQMLDVSALGEKPFYKFTTEKLKTNAKYLVHVKAMTESGLGDSVTAEMKSKGP